MSSKIHEHRPADTGPPDESVERVLALAEQHGRESGAEFECGDLQSLVWAAWRAMTVGQRASWLAEAEEMAGEWVGEEEVTVASHSLPPRAADTSPMRSLGVLIASEVGPPPESDTIYTSLIRRVGQLSGRPVEGDIAAAADPHDLLVSLIARMPVGHASDLLISPEVVAVADPGDDLRALLARHPDATSRRAIWKHAVATVADWRTSVVVADEEAAIDALELPDAAEAVAWALWLKCVWGAIRNDEVPAVLGWRPDRAEAANVGMGVDAQWESESVGVMDVRRAKLERLKGEADAATQLAGRLRDEADEAEHRAEMCRDEADEAEEHAASLREQAQAFEGRLRRKAENSKGRNE